MFKGNLGGRIFQVWQQRGHAKKEHRTTCRFLVWVCCVDEKEENKTCRLEFAVPGESWRVRRESEGIIFLPFTLKE